MGIDAWKYYFKGYKNFILWQQGATGEESFLRHRNKIRRLVLNKIDCFVMKKAKFIFFVSDSLKTYYETYGKTMLGYKSYVMPCFNEELNEDIFEKKDYSKLSFCYVGSLAKWQCFDKIVDLFATIQKHHDVATLKVLTFEREKAEEVLLKKKIRNFVVKTVSKEEVKNELAECNYGFIIRDNIVVNNVSTPTKMSSYLCAGVIPIFSSCITDFTRVFNGFKYIISENNGVFIIPKRVDRKEVCEEFKTIFDTYYNKQKHIKNIIESFLKINLGEKK